jgi:glycosidase
MPTDISPGPWPKYPLLYEINTRVWLNELSAKAGERITLDKVPSEEIDKIARHGFQAIWLMGVWTTNDDPIQMARTLPELQPEYRHALPDLTTEDIIGSPYAISTYQVSPLLGGPAALARFRERIGRHGMRLMLDFVCNHTARDHRFVLERPDVYVQGSAEDLARQPNCFFKTANGHIIACGRDPYFPPWMDTAQVNYGHPAGREAMKEKIRSIAQQCDGVRCDMAMLILPDIIERVWGSRLGNNWNRKSFWKEAIDEINARWPNFLFMAESYWDLEWQLQQEGFQYTYDKTLYDRLREGDHDGVRKHLNAAIKFQDRCARFVENHDEPRAAAAFGPARARSAATVSFFAPGLKLFHEGQLEGRRVKVPVQLGRRKQESEDIETSLFYEKLLGALQDPMFQEGVFSPSEVRSAGWGDSSNDSLIAMSWFPPAGKSGRHCQGFLIVANMNAWRAYGRVSLGGSRINANKNYIFHDRLDGKRYERPGSELVSPGIYIALEAHQQHIFEIIGKE